MEAAMSSTRDREIDEMLAERAIHKVILRSAQASDRGDYDLMVSCFWPDATMDAGIFNGSISSLFAMIKDAPVIPDYVLKHVVGNVLIEVHLEDHCARSETYCFGGDRSVAADGTVMERVTHVRYIDRFEERNGEWRIQKRLVAYDWSTSTPVTGTDLMQPSFLTGKRAPDDAWHHILD
jgi:hypothetical protein